MGVVGVEQTEIERREGGRLLHDPPRSHDLAVSRRIGPLADTRDRIPVRAVIGNLERCGVISLPILRIPGGGRVDEEPVLNPVNHVAVIKQLQCRRVAGCQLVEAADPQIVIVLRFERRRRRAVAPSCRIDFELRMQTKPQPGPHGLRRTHGHASRRRVIQVGRTGRFEPHLKPVMRNGQPLTEAPLRVAWERLCGSELRHDSPICTPPALARRSVELHRFYDGRIELEKQLRPVDPPEIREEETGGLAVQQRSQDIGIEGPFLFSLQAFHQVVYVNAEIAGELRAGRVKRQPAQLARHGIGKEQDDFGDTVVDALDIQRPAQGFALGWVWRIERESPCATEDHADRPASQFSPAAFRSIATAS